ncbi:putative fatty acyl-CoA reductase CG5065 [Epargyreus clarus]|uniref:putative fatty acyl-CoA reductase CG5065 n=1 Tax=Epargyreus clarus TaxID=520877 RepID=UPI003C2C0957
METLEYSEDNTYQPVSEAYAGRSIFMSGATGFLGKVFVEKILYSCPKISKIYVLVREKKNISADDRIRKMLELPIFNRLRNERPEDMKKIIPVQGDIAFSKLGLKPEDEEMLIKTVSMVFHFAATIKFNEPLQTAFTINVKGTKRMLELCHKMNDIKAFIYVSTAFSNSGVDVIKEVLYPPPVPLEEAEELEDRTNFTKEETDEILKRGQKPNSYTFTKAIAENIVSKEHGNIPCAIIRPSIVVSSKEEPIVGWLDNWFGATGVLFPTAQGLNRVLLCDYHNNIDLIPVDYVVNVIIVAAAKCKRSSEISIYNCCTSCENPITIGKFVDISTTVSVDRIKSIPLMSKTLMTQSEWLVSFITILQKIPAILSDCILYASGKQTKYVKYQERIVRARDLVMYFTSRTWQMSAERTCALFASLSATDQKRFAFDPRSIVWAEFVPSYNEGVRKFLLKSS